MTIPSIHGMRILITGADGQLGRALRHALGAHDLIRTGHGDLDVTDREAVGRAITDCQPDAVVHCAAWTDTVACENDPERARLANGDAPGFVATACRDSRARMIHVSSNEVFDGSKGSPYTEGDAVNPINEYGRSKLVGEQAVAAALAEHQIVRTSWLYGPGRVSFPEKILERARAEGRLRLVTDEIASPTWTLDLAKAIGCLLEHREYGVFHLANAGECSRKDWAEEILRQCGIDIPVEATTQAAFDLPYRKPVTSTLANLRAASLGIKMRPWQEALADHLRETGILTEETSRV